MINIFCGIFALISLMGFIFGFSAITKKWKDYEINEKVGNIVFLFVIFILFCLMAILTIYPEIISTF